MMGRAMEQLLPRLSSRLGIERDWGVLVIASLLGIVMGLAAPAFLGPIQWLEARIDEQGEHGVPGIVLVLAAPIAGALLTSVVFALLPLPARGHGVTWVLYALNRERSLLPARLGVRQWLGSTLTIGSGGSAGPEGPIVTIGATIGSVLGRRLGVSPSELATLVGCGAAAGVASVFNAPLAGIFFVLEVLLRDFSLRTFTPIVIASVMGTTTAQTVLGSRPPLFGVGPDFFERAPPNFTVAQVPSFILLGAVTAIVAVLLIRAMRISIRLFARLPGPPGAKPIWGAVLLALLGGAYLVFANGTPVAPPFYGTGYSVIRQMLGPAWYTGSGDGSSELMGASLMLAAWVALKAIASVSTVGSGGAGGLFAPSLFLGAAVGGA
ncbi:MAG: chloride channel protein, partial [Phycisphaerae bacterium]|nr:chloride channel protein [Phycisphaerae bacterium]